MHAEGWLPSSSSGFPRGLMDFTGLSPNPYPSPPKLGKHACVCPCECGFPSIRSAPTPAPHCLMSRCVKVTDAEIEQVSPLARALRRSQGACETRSDPFPRELAPACCLASPPQPSSLLSGCVCSTAHPPSRPAYPEVSSLVPGFVSVALRDRWPPITPWAASPALLPQDSLCWHLQAFLPIASAAGTCGCTLPKPQR